MQTVYLLLSIYKPSGNSYSFRKFSQSIYSDQLSKQVRRKYVLGLLSLITHKENKQHSQPNTPWAHYYSSISNTHLLHHRHHPSNVGQRLPTYASPQRYYHLQSLNWMDEREFQHQNHRHSLITSNIIFPNDTGWFIIFLQRQPSTFPIVQQQGKHSLPDTDRLQFISISTKGLTVSSVMIIHHHLPISAYYIITIANCLKCMCGSYHYHLINLHINTILHHMNACIICLLPPQHTHIIWHHDHTITITILWNIQHIISSLLYISTIGSSNKKEAYQHDIFSSYSTWNFICHWWQFGRCQRAYKCKLTRITLIISLHFTSIFSVFTYWAFISLYFCVHTNLMILSFSSLTLTYYLHCSSQKTTVMVSLKSILPSIVTTLL